MSTPSNSIIDKTDLANVVSAVVIVGWACYAVYYRDIESLKLIGAVALGYLFGQAGS